ncbi:oxidative stress defense protein [Shewanella sp. Isolate11]|uniref:oxidative stress defense protein n=1 Tax=Shewanella sp. Isolate11 TaxID=2908530 RepID=UPI001EFDE1E9|nr:oxidative stress defense protein [Shewanella sp. Isolate11]MCG9695660.1 oxidative stress defense protein [Shewanella sp. Isolate11]
MQQSIPTNLNTQASLPPTNRLITSACAAALALTILFSGPISANEVNFPHIETIGSSEIQIDADMAEINVEVMVQELTPVQAKNQADKAVADFIARLIDEGVPRTDIQSANLQLSPRYVYDTETRRNNKVGYKANRQLTITVNKLDMLNQILDNALAEGLNRVNNIAFKSSQQQALIEKARLLAIKDAQQKAQSLAQGFGQQLGGIWKIRYYDQRPIQSVMYRMEAAQKADVAQSYQQAQISISDRVEVIYQLSQ